MHILTPCITSWYFCNKLYNILQSAFRSIELYFLIRNWTGFPSSVTIFFRTNIWTPGLSRFLARFLIYTFILSIYHFSGQCYCQHSKERYKYFFYTTAIGFHTAIIQTEKNTKCLYCYCSNWEFENFDDALSYLEKWT